MRYVLIISGFFYTLLNCIILPLAYSPSQIWRYFAIMWQSDRIDNGAIIVLMVLNVAMLLFTIILGVHFYRKPTKFAKYVRQGRKYSRSGYLYTSDVRARMIVSIYPKD
jgi:hypothetical protein